MEPNLTPSQNETYKSLSKLFPHYQCILIKGDQLSGKFTVINNFLKCNLLDYITFDMVKFVQNLTSDNLDLSGQYLSSYLSSLIKHAVNPVTLVIKNFNKISEILSDINVKLRYLFPYLFSNFIETLPSNVKVIMTSTLELCYYPVNLFWTIDHNSTREDTLSILMNYNNIIPSSILLEISNISKIVSIGKIVYCMKYALIYPEDFVNKYYFALSKFYGTHIDIKKDIPEPNPEIDLVGMENIIDELNTSIILPLSLSIQNIPIKKGLVICGPPGTGKTSLGKWLAHKIKGKFYMIGGDVSDSSMVDMLDITLHKAKENSPAVIFIDDCDVLFTNKNTYRAFLTFLDGIETNKRNDICIMLTCMDLKNVPQALLRGERLEMTLITKLPEIQTIEKILTNTLKHMDSLLLVHDITVSYDSLFIKTISQKMFGWNCADIRRCTHDVTRLIISKKSTDLNLFFNTCMKQITTQYKYCGKTESTNIDDNVSYCM